MSRAKSKQTPEVCGDCGALDATWASVNKGILLCTQCCSIHRSLGRHISQVKSLLKSTWPTNQLNMVCGLNNNGANNIWEHALLENGSKLMKKKPTPKDPLSVKQEYIKAKHLNCVYAFKENYEDGLLSVENELGKQLHASVRTPNLETSFRLLALGADPNYFHDEKGSTPLHVAVKSDQKLQVELLLVYGADPSCPDNHGQTPIDYARKFMNKELLNRLIESYYEVTDTFSYYLSLHKPDHSSGVHFHIPQTGFKSNPASLSKLQKLSNAIFEELAMDVFDEVDRRETEAIWLSCADTTDLQDVPFLPVDNTLSTTRNQGRQKLARFSTPELKSLVFDILIDSQRRQMIADKGTSMLLRDGSVIDEDPLYDSVASDDDYATVPEDQEATLQKESPQLTDKESAISLHNVKTTNQILQQLTTQLKNSNNTITDLKVQISKLKQHIETLESENSDLKNRLSQTKAVSRVNGDSGFDSLGFISENQIADTDLLSNGGNSDEIDNIRHSRKIQRPTSMYETREGITKVPYWHAMKNQMKQGDQSRNVTHSLYFSTQDREVVLQCSQQITKSIQQLYKSIQEPEKEDCANSAEKVQSSLVRLASNLPKINETDGERMKYILELGSRLHPECLALQLACQKGDATSVDTHFRNVKDIAYHLAKFTRDIITKYSSNQ